MRQPMENKTCLITGATSGIGFFTARELAAKGMRVVLVGRDPAKTQAATEQIKRETGSARVEYLVADLSSQAEVRRLADDFKRRCIPDQPQWNQVVLRRGVAVDVVTLLELYTHFRRRHFVSFCGNPARRRDSEYVSLREQATGEQVRGCGCSPCAWSCRGGEESHSDIHFC